MPNSIRISYRLLPQNLHDSSQNLSRSSQLRSFSSIRASPAAAATTPIDHKIIVIARRFKSTTTFAAYVEEGSLPQFDDDSPLPLQLESISNDTQFDCVIQGAQQLHQPLIIVWMASWCRKCIYLKPKLEKLAVDYYPRLRFYCVDVNAVPHKLVSRAGVTKMPTIQLWKDGKQQAEVIGRHKAYLVVNEVRAMIESENES